MYTLDYMANMPENNESGYFILVYIRMSFSGYQNQCAARVCLRGAQDAVFRVWCLLGSGVFCG